MCSSVDLPGPGLTHDRNEIPLFYREVDLLQDIVKAALQFVTFLDVF